MNSADFKIISNSLVNSLFCNEWHSMTIDELAHICKAMDYPNIEDRFICDNPQVYPYIQWDRLEKMQAVRIATRHPELLDRIDLKKHQYKIKEIFYFVQADYTRIFKYFDFDFSNLSQEDAYFLLCLGKDEFFEIIDVNKYSFGFIETLDIIKAYDCRRDIITSLNYKLLKNYQVTEIFIRTGEEFLDLFDLNMLSTLNWLDLLSYQPNFLLHCDFEKFTDGDPFNLIQLITMFQSPDLTYLLDKIDVDEITAFGWEKLLIYKTDKCVSLCDFHKLKENNWIEILKVCPELVAHKII